jgi:hypothetical protein
LKSTMTNWKKAYTTWVNTAIAVLAAVSAAVLHLTAQNTTIPAHVLAEVLAGVGALTVFLRALPQNSGEK